MPLCSNGGCTRGATVLVQIGVRSTDERGVCRPCAEALASLYPVQRPVPGIPEWRRRAADHRLPGRIDGGVAA